MTIVGGFKVQDGILVYADTLWTGGSRVHQPKIFDYKFGDDSCSAVFAVAGHEANAKMAIEDCMDALADLRAEACTFTKIKSVLRSAVKSIHDGYVGADDDSRFDLVIGAWIPLSGGLRLFRTFGPALTSGEDYYCGGRGSYLGDYIMRDVFKPYMRTRDAFLLATQALTAAKSYDDTCGGDSQFMAISPTGEASKLLRYDVTIAEKYIGEYKRASLALLFSVGDTELSKDTFDGHLKTFFAEAYAIRKEWTGKAESHRWLVEVLTKVSKGSPEKIDDIPDFPEPGGDSGGHGGGDS